MQYPSLDTDYNRFSHDQHTHNFQKWQHIKPDPKGLLWSISFSLVSFKVLIRITVGVNYHSFRFDVKETLWHRRSRNPSNLCEDVFPKCVWMCSVYDITSQTSFNKVQFRFGHFRPNSARFVCREQNRSHQKNFRNHRKKQIRLLKIICLITLKQKQPQLKNIKKTFELKRDL
jgi:hypothetical protein